MHRRGLGLLLVLVAVADAAPAAPALPSRAAEFVAVPGSRSPDGAWEVAIPSLASQEEGTPPRCETRIVNVQSGALLGRIPGECFHERQGQSQVSARWSADGHTLLWLATNKWGMANVQVVRIADGKLVKTFDVRPPAQKRVLAFVRRTSPALYTRTQRHGRGAGSWFRDGFAIDVRPAGTGALTWPLALTIDITSDHKCDRPAADRTGGTMAATLDAKLNWTFGPFVAGHAGCGTNGLVCAFSDCE